MSSVVLDRTEVLLTAIDSLLVVHDEWVAGNEDLLTMDYESAIHVLIDTFDEGDIPGTFREAWTAVGQLKVEWARFVEGATRKNPLPSDSFWAAIANLRSARNTSTESERIPIEPLEMLEKQGVSHRQIAVIYSHNGRGPFLRGGEPMVHLVRQELARPGSVIPEGWVHPQEEERQRELRELQSKSLARIQEKQKAAQKAANCPETIEELLQQNVFPSQIAKMHGVTVAEVMQVASKAGISLPAESDLGVLPAVFQKEELPVPVSAEEDDDDDEARESTADGDESVPSDPRDAVFYWKDRGASLTEISKQTGLKITQVNSILKTKEKK